MAHVPTQAKQRKAIPVYSGLVRYFPDALLAVAELSRIGNDQHNPGKPLHWDRSKSQDELDALTRHLVDAGSLDADGVRHSTKIAWRALANLQKEIEAARKHPIQAIEDHPAHPRGGLERWEARAYEELERMIAEGHVESSIDTSNMQRMDK